MTSATFAVFVILAIFGLTIYGAWCWLTSHLDRATKEIDRAPYDWERTWAEELTDEQCERLLRAIREEVHGDG